MKTLRDELDALAKKTEAEHEALVTKYKALAFLPLDKLEGYAPPRVHVYSLYGSVGSFNWAIQRYSSIGEGKSPDAALLRLLLAQFTPEPVVRVKDGCTSFRPEPESYTNNGEYLDVDPVMITVEPGVHSQHTKVEWYAKVGGELWHMSVEMQLHVPRLFKLDIIARWSAGGHGDISSYERCELRPVSADTKYIKWASGARQYPNTFTVYWERGHNVDIPALFE